jgi:hypothetical protein
MNTNETFFGIIVADQGHVWIGDITVGPVWVEVKRSRCVRRWGTNKGLNQLAMEGPLPETTLDEPADMFVRQASVIALIPCKESAWAKHQWK